MAVRVPRVAAEAVIAALLIGAGCFMLLDLSGKQASTAVGGAAFSAKLQGKFMQLATNTEAILPVPCTDAEATITGLPGVCNLLNGQQGCCSAASLNAQLLPDLSNCSSRCQSYYAAFYCYFSCKQGQYRSIGGNQATVAVCRPELQTLFNACNTQTCKVLNPGTIQGGDADFNSFIATNAILTRTAAEGCADFTQFGRRCEETAAPTIRSLQVTNLDDDSVATAIPSGGRTFEFAADGSTPDATFGYPLKVCVDIVNPRPQGCTTQPPGVNSAPLSANIVVEATGGVAYTVANAVISSQDLVEVPGAGGQPTVFRGCVDIKILPFNTVPYTLTFSASAVNTFGTGTSAGLNGNTNTLTLPVAIPDGTNINTLPAYTLNADLQICQTAADGIVVGSNSFYAPLGENGAASFEVNNINCCEVASAPGANTGDNVNNGFRAQCIINGQGTNRELRTTGFAANAVSTTIRLVTLVVTGAFEAQGSIVLVNAKINIGAGGNFNVGQDTALRGGTGTSLNFLANSQLNIANNIFLITLGSIDVNAVQDTQVILADSARFVVAETSRLISDNAQYTLGAAARVVQYTQSPGGIRLFSSAVAVLVDGPAPSDPAGPGVTNAGVVAVSGTYVSYNNPLVAGASVTYEPVETRISTSRGPNAPAQVGATEKDDNDAVPTDAAIPGEGPTTFSDSTGKKFQSLITPPTNSRATLQLCGTTNNIVTIPSQGTLLVSPPSNYAAPRCQVTGLATHALDIGTLNVATGGIISITGVDGAFLPIRVSNVFNVAQGANIRVTLAAGINTGAIANLVLFDTTGATNPAGDLCSLISNIEIINQGNRVVTPTCTATGIALTFSAVQAPPPPQFNAGLFTSALEYCLLLRQSVASFDRSSFLLAIDNNFGPETTRSVVAIAAFTQDTNNADNLRVTFRCYDYSSVSNADLRCSNIVNSANQANSGFRSAVLAVGSCGTLAVNPNDNDDSNHGLYGLFGLIAIPIILLCLVCLLIRQSRRRADNQYMQDAATFSNVASGPQPLATAVPAVQYDVAKEIYPAVAAPAIAYPAY